MNGLILLALSLAALLAEHYLAGPAMDTPGFLTGKKGLRRGAVSGLVTALVVLLSAAALWALERFALAPVGLEVLAPAARLGLAWLLVWLTGLVAERWFPRLGGLLEGYLPFVTANGFLVLSVLGGVGGNSFGAYMLRALLYALGFWAASLLAPAMLCRLEEADPPKVFRGLPLALLTAALAVMAALAFFQ